MAKVQTGAKQPIVLSRNVLEELKNYRAEQDRISKMSFIQQKKLIKDNERYQLREEIKEQKAKDEKTLRKELAALRERHLKFFNKAKAINSSDDAVDIIIKYEKKILQVALKLTLPREIIQATLYRELICFGLDDIVKDGLVINYHIARKGYGIPGINDIQEAAYEKAGGADSSVGLGQIFAKTAILAEQRVNNNIDLDYNNKNHLWNMWNKLHDDSTNIYYTGLILRMEAENQNVNIKSMMPAQVKNVLAGYNGGAHYQCSDAQCYGSQTKQYYDVFKKYQK